MKLFDVIIPVATKDVGFVPLVVKYIRMNIVGANRIFALTNKANIRKLCNTVCDRQFAVLDENELVERLTFSNIRTLLAKAGEKRSSQTGWYFQQFLKFAFAHTKYAKEYYLSWDADTLPMNKIEFFAEHGKPLLTKKIEYHVPYFKTMDRLIGIGRQVDYSFIAEHMLFSSAVVCELTDAIMCSNVEGKTWFGKIINACEFAENKVNLYSEFETYGNYCAKHYPNMYDTRTLNTFRAAGLIRGRHVNNHLIERLAIDLHIASFEMQDAPFPYNIKWNIYRGKCKVLSMVRSLLGG